MLFAHFCVAKSVGTAVGLTHRYFRIFSARVKVLFLRSGSLSCIRCIIWPAKLPHFLPISGIPITLHIICTERANNFCAEFRLRAAYRLGGRWGLGRGRIVVSLCIIQMKGCKKTNEASYRLKEGQRNKEKLAKPAVYSARA